MSQVRWSRWFLHILLLGAVLSVIRCAPRPSVPSDSPATTAFSLLEDFEAQDLWSVESADNHALLETESQERTSGQQALKVTTFPLGRGKATVRREVDYDLSRVRHLRLDAFNATADVALLALGFRTSAGDHVFQTRPVPLAAGWNRGIVFSLKPADFLPLEGEDTERLWIQERGRVRRLLIVLPETTTSQGQVIVDNLQADAPADVIRRSSPPRILSVSASAPVVPQYGLFELTVDFEGSYVNAFDPQYVEVAASFIAPDDGRHRVLGFLHGYEAEGRRKRAVWRVRFAPTLPGPWRYDVMVRTRHGETFWPQQEFEVTAAPDTHGFVRISEVDPSYFATDDGTFLYPLGQNVCWASDYEYYFKKICAYGGNYVRIWMCPWNLWLEPKGRLGWYDLNAAGEFDRVLELAERYELYIQLVTEYHGSLNLTWDRNPYNRANGGPCETPADFFRSVEAKRCFRNRLRYIAARWGYSPHVFAWELMNEADITPHAAPQDVVAWHREMAEAIKEFDVHRHLVTTSTAAVTALPALWQIPEIDFTQSHMYTPHPFEEVPAHYARRRGDRKPYFIGEFGRGWRPSDDQVDPEGRLLHVTLWLAAMTPSAGNAMPWWWDTYIDPKDLYGHFKGLAAFLDGQNRIGENLRPLRRTLDLAQGHSVELVGLINHHSIFLWLYNPQLVLHPLKGPANNLLTKDVTLRFDGMLGGQYAVEFWDPYTGNVLDTQTLFVDGGRLTVTLPRSDLDFAVKIFNLETHEPGLAD